MLSWFLVYLIVNIISLKPNLVIAPSFVYRKSSSYNIWGVSIPTFLMLFIHSSCTLISDDHRISQPLKHDCDRGACLWWFSTCLWRTVEVRCIPIFLSQLSWKWGCHLVMDVFIMRMSMRLLHWWHMMLSANGVSFNSMTECAH